MESTQRLNSIFDYYHKTANPSSAFKWEFPHNYKVKKSDFIFTGKLQELDASTSNLYPIKFYGVTPTKIFRFAVYFLGLQSQNDVYPEAILKLLLPRIEIFREQFCWKYGFSLTAHETTFKFLHEKKEDSVKWFNQLRKMCEVVSLHFSHDFIAGKILSRNSYWKIRIAASTGTEVINKYSVKSVLKSGLLENSKILVLISNK